MKLYNTLTRKLEDFKPINIDEVRIYTCGPTVYSRSHIGNLAAYVYWDLLIRTMRLEGYKVKRVMNITDVGHLTSDGDTGEDKLEKGARLSGKTVWEVADHYTKLFLDDMKKINWVEPEMIIKATDCIDEDLEIVKILIDKGLTYETEDGIYFDTSKFPKYADFARLDIDNLQAGARVEFNSEKRNVSDFAIWKWVRPNEDHAMKWRFLDRDGYPGWHLECATIIHVTLGQPIDIHTGGIDHIPVHHTNEIAEAEAAFDKPLANYWLHCNHVTSDGKKISKSLGNGYSLDDLEKKGYTGLDYKMWVLQGNYQAERNFSFDDLKAAAARLKNYKNWVVLRYQMKAEDDSGLIELKNRMMNHLTNNLNSAGALAELDKAMNVLVPNDEFVEFLDEIFGLDFLKIQDIDDKTREKIAARNAAKNNKNYDIADKIRDELAKDGIKLEDRADMILWQLL